MEACFECGQPAESSHHVVPESRGGTRTVPLCGGCHAKAHHRKGNMAISSLVKAVMAAKKVRGERLGQIPYGYVLSPDGVHVEPDPAWSAVLTMIREMRDDGMSLRAIAAELNDRRIPTKRGRPWIYSTIHGILAAI